MIYKGHIKNGVVVLDQPTQLPEGAEVTIEVAQPGGGSSLSERLRDVIGKATDIPPDASTQKRHYLYGHPKT